MKKTASILILTLTMAFIVAEAQTTNTFIKGTLNINYESRAKKGVAGVNDIYTMRLNVSDSALFHGSITNTPLVLNSLGFVSQPASISAKINCEIINPKNTAQTAPVGSIYGLVPIDKDGVYRFTDGSLQMAITGRGNANDMTGKFSGVAAGKPLVKTEGWKDRLSKSAMNITKMVNGKAVAVAIKKYDKMTFDRHVMAAGPIRAYPEATVNGEMIFDYDRNVWYFNNVGISYNSVGKKMEDTLTGNIRWLEDKKQYEFDVRLNEPPPSEASVFAGGGDEASFFQTDDSVPSLTGIMKYQDSATSSAVVVDLKGNKLGKEQVMNLFKLIFVTSIVPINAE